MVKKKGHLRPHNKTFKSLLLVLRCHQVITADVLIADNNSAQCFITMTRQPPVGHGLIIYEVSRAQKTTRHIRQDFSERVISPTQRHLPDNTQHSQQTDIHATGGIRTHSLSRRAVADLRLRPRGHWDRLFTVFAEENSEGNLYWLVYENIIPVLQKVPLLKMCRKKDAQFHAFLTSMLFGGVWSISRSSCFTSQEKYSGCRVDSVKRKLMNSHLSVLNSSTEKKFNYTQYSQDMHQGL